MVAYVVATGAYRDSWFLEEVAVDREGISHIIKGNYDQLIPFCEQIVSIQVDLPAKRVTVKYHDFNGDSEVSHLLIFKIPIA